MLLPSRAASSNARAAFLQLPSHLRLFAHQQSSRSFSASPSRKSELADIVAAPPLAILNTLHAVGIPWYAAIPTAAILIRGVFVHYAASAPARRRQQIRTHLTPLTAAKTNLELRKKDDMAKRKVDPAVRRIAAIWINWMQSHAIGKLFGGGIIARTSFINWPTLIATVEAMRRMCGAREGLLSTLMTPFSWLGRQIAPQNFVDPMEETAQLLAQRMEQVREARLKQAQEQGSQPWSGSENVFHSPQIPEMPQPPPVNTESLHFQPTLQTEGLSWCTDLTLPDPTSMIPLAVVASMWANILVNPLPVRRRLKTPKYVPTFVTNFVSRYSTIQFFGMLFAHLFYIVLKDMPAALALYFLASTLTATASRKVLEWTIPIRRPIVPCARGLRIRSKKEWSARQ